ncbi:hypothetical protein, partial [Escherichia coli]
LKVMSTKETLSSKIYLIFIMIEIT